jgi:hypothetical protein
MKFLAISLALVLGLSMPVSAKGNVFKVRYNAGMLAIKFDPEDWDNKLMVTSEAILLELKDGQSLNIPPSSVTAISYGQEAHRRVGTMVTLAIIFSPVALFGLFHKTKLHYVGIEYSLPDGKKGGLLLQAHKDNYRGLLVALSGVTGKSVEQDMAADATSPEKAQKQQDKDWDKQPIGQGNQTAPPPPTVTPQSNTAKKCYENGRKVACP